MGFSLSFGHLHVRTIDVNLIRSHATCKYSLLFVVVIRIVPVLDFVLPLPGLYAESIGKVRDFYTTLLVV